MSKKSELEDQVARLTILVEEMRARMAGLEGAAGRPAGIEVPRSRRDILRLGGAAALGAVGAAALRAVPAAATNGAAVLAGQNNTSTLPTTVTGSPAPAEILGAVQSDFDSAALTASGEVFSGPLQGLGGVSWDGTGAPAPFAEGVDGFATGATAYGVYGLTDSGTGVTGESSTGTSVYARGSGRVRQDPHGLAAASYWPGSVPNYAPNQVEQVRDAAGTLWLSNAAGNWRRASTFEVFPTPRRVYGPGTFLVAGTIVTNIDATTKMGGGSSGVPPGVIAAWCAVQSFEPAVLSIYPAGSPDPGLSNFGVTGAAGNVQMLYMMVPLNALGRFSFKNRKTTARIFIDVWGYLSQAAT